MRGPVLWLASAGLALSLVVGTPPGTLAQGVVRHYIDADEIGTPGDDRAADVDAASGFVASAGVADGQLDGQTAGGAQDAYVRLVDEDRLVHWTRQFGGTGDDQANAVATDGTIVVVGGQTDSLLAGPPHGGTDGWLRLFDITGDTLWSKQLGAATDDAIEAVALTDDAVYAAGTLDHEGVVWKLDLDGNVRWTSVVADYDPDNYAYGGVPEELVVLDDRVVVAVHFPDHYDADPCSGVQALADDTGGHDWYTSCFVHDIAALSTDGADIYLAGTSASTEDAVVAAYHPNGQQIWAGQVYAGLDLADVTSSATGADWDGRALVVAVSDDSRDADALVGFSRTGRRQWIERMPGGFDSATVSSGVRGLAVGGATTGDLGGDNAGGEDALVASFFVFQPDAQARRGDGPVAGADRYGRAGQALVVHLRRGGHARVTLFAQNDGELPQALRLSGCGDRNGYTFSYRRRDADLTSVVTGPGYRSPTLAPAESAGLTLTIRARRSAEDRSRCTFTARSPGSGDRDRVTIKLRRP